MRLCIFMRPLLFQCGVGGAAAAVARLGCTPDLTPQGLMDGGVLGERLRTIGKPSEPCVPVSPRTQRREHSYGQMSQLTLSHHPDRPPRPHIPNQQGMFPGQGSDCNNNKTEISPTVGSRWELGTEAELDPRSPVWNSDCSD